MSDPFMDVINFLSEKYMYFELIPAFIGVILNVFHLIILTQKSMRTSSINTVMIGISICDLLNMAHIIYKDVTIYMNSDVECTNAATQPAVITYLILTAIKEISGRLSSYLGIILASIRLLIVKTSVNHKLNRISKPIFGVKISFLFLFLSFLVSMFYFGRIRIIDLEILWTPAPHCNNFPPNYKEHQYMISFTDFLMIESEMASQIYFILDGVLKVISSVLLPILTIFLILELKVARQKISIAQLSNPSKSSKSDHTTKLVTLMTITFMIADGPIGIISFIRGIFISQNFMESLSLLAMCLSILNIFITFNASIHCIISLTVSSHYRETAKLMFTCQKEDENRLFKTSRVSGTGNSGNAR